MNKGTIKFYNSAKGFGFIVNDKDNKDIFVHNSGLKYKSPRDGDRVTFDTEQGKKGLNAVDVKLEV